MPTVATLFTTEPGPANLYSFKGGISPWARMVVPEISVMPQLGAFHGSEGILPATHSVRIPDGNIQHEIFLPP